MNQDVPLHIIHLDQDDPKKCTARKLASRDLARLHFDTRRPPRRGFLLDPSAGVILGPDDFRSLSVVQPLLHWIVLGNNSKIQSHAFVNHLHGLNPGHCPLYWQPTLYHGGNLVD